jgi:hypothetical protein
VPISQQRMIALIAAGQDYLVGFTNMQKFVSKTIDRFNMGDISAEAALGQIQTTMTPLAFVNRPIESERVLEQEHFHFSRNYKRNEREARYLAHKRREEGTQRHNTAPRSLRALQPHGFRIDEQIEGSVADAQVLTGRNIPEGDQWAINQQIQIMGKRKDAEEREARRSREAQQRTAQQIAEMDPAGQSALTREAENIRKNNAMDVEALGEVVYTPEEEDKS